MRSLVLSDFIYCKRIETVFGSELLTFWKQWKKIRIFFILSHFLVWNLEHTMKLPKKIICNNNTKMKYRNIRIYFVLRSLFEWKINARISHIFVCIFHSSFFFSFFLVWCESCLSHSIPLQATSKIHMRTDGMCNKMQWSMS